MGEREISTRACERERPTAETAAASAAAAEEEEEVKGRPATAAERGSVSRRHGLTGKVRNEFISVRQVSFAVLANQI